MSDDRVRVVYGWRAASRWVFLIVVAAATVILVPVLISGVLTADTWFWRVLPGLLLAGWLAWAPLALWRTAFTIELTARTLRWRGALRRGEVPIAAVSAIRPVPVLEVGGCHALVAEGHPAVWFLVSRGFNRFVADLERTGPVDVRLSWASSRPDRMPGRSQYREIADPTDPF